MLPQLLHVLATNPLLLLFLVAAVGYPLGQLRVGGSPIGVAAVLFVGLVAGGLDPALALPEIVYMLGLHEHHLRLLRYLGIECGGANLAAGVELN